MNNALRFALMLGVLAAVFAVPAFALPAPACIPIGGVPEPSTLAMLASGLGGIVVLRRLLKK